jgi:trimeric autotransporter adhesin
VTAKALTSLLKATSPRHLVTRHSSLVGAAGSGPIAFANGTPSSALTYSFVGLGNGGDDVELSNNGGTSWTYTPVANASGCDPAVTHIKSEAEGTMAAASGAGNPYFEVRFCVRVN